jgi:hypothetical protein
MAATADVELKMPRIVGRQTVGANAPSSPPEEHYRKNLYLPYIDHLLMELKSMFGDAVPRSRSLCSRYSISR